MNESRKEQKRGGRPEKEEHLILERKKREGKQRTDASGEPARNAFEFNLALVVGHSLGRAMRTARRRRASCKEPTHCYWRFLWLLCLCLTSCARTQPSMAEPAQSIARSRAAGLGGSAHLGKSFVQATRIPGGGCQLGQGGPGEFILSGYFNLSRGFPSHIASRRSKPALGSLFIRKSRPLQDQRQDLVF